MATATDSSETVSHLPFDARRTYTGRYRNWFYREHADKLQGRVLDVGAGSGWSSDQYHKLSGKITEYLALDIEPDGSLDLIADGTQLPLQDETFDTVILSAVLEHIPISKIPSILSEARRVLRPGGKLIAGIPHQYPLHDEPHDFWRPTVFGMQDVLENAGFDEIETFRGGSYSEVLLNTLFYPFRAITLYLGVRQLAWLFAPAHYTICLLARIGALSLKGVYGQNPFGSRWYVQNFVVAGKSSPAGASQL